MPSAEVLVAVEAGPWLPPTDGVDADPSDTISVKLSDSLGVDQWWLAVVGVDELTTYPDLTGTSLTGEVIPVSGTVTFDMPSAQGRAVRLKSTIRVGINSYVTTFAVYTPTDLGRRVGAFGETVEGSSSVGWTTKVNPLLREVHRQETLAAEAIAVDQVLAAELSKTPVSSTSVRLWLNGLLQRQGVGKDYVVTGKQITWLALTGTAVDMDVDDELIVSYLGQG